MQRNEIVDDLKTNARHVCTYLNAFLMLNPDNMVTKFNNSMIFDNFGTHFDLSSAHACHVVSDKIK